jgi:hypothetical protein
MPVCRTLSRELIRTQPKLFSSLPSIRAAHARCTIRQLHCSRPLLANRRPAGANEKFNKEPFPLVYIWFTASSAFTLYFAYRFLFGVTGDKDSVKRSFRRGLELRKSGTQLAEDAAEKLPASLPRVFLDIDVDGNPTGRLVFALRSDVVPKTAENFR